LPTQNVKSQLGPFAASHDTLRQNPQLVAPRIKFASANRLSHSSSLTLLPIAHVNRHRNFHIRFIYVARYHFLLIQNEVALDLEKELPFLFPVFLCGKFVLKITFPNCNSHPFWALNFTHSQP
jgi:hypothetical protein